MASYYFKIGDTISAKVYLPLTTCVSNHLHMSVKIFIQSVPVLSEESRTLDKRPMHWSTSFFTLLYKASPLFERQIRERQDE